MVVEPGLTTIEAPLPAGVPLQLPVNHCQLAAVPRVPPFTVNVALLPEHKLLVLVLIEVGAVEFIFTLTSVLAQLVVLHEPTAFT